MTKKELLKMLVETESMEDRMQLVEDNMEMFAGGEAVDTSEMEGQLSDALQNLETATAKIKELEQKYRDRFFEDDVEDNSNPDEKDENENADNDGKTLADLGY